MQEVRRARLDTNHFGGWHDGLHHRGNTRKERRAAGDDKDRVEAVVVRRALQRRPDLLHRLERDRALAGDDVRVVVRLHEVQRRVGRYLRVHVLLGLLERLAVDDDARAGALDREAALQRHALRHDDCRRDAQRARGDGDRVALAAHGVRNNARARVALVVGEEVVCAAQLEGEGGQQVLALQVHVRAQPRGEAARKLQRRLRDHVVDARGEREPHVIGVRRVRLELLAVAQAAGPHRRLLARFGAALLLLEPRQRRADAVWQATHAAGGVR